MNDQEESTTNRTSTNMNGLQLGSVLKLMGIALLVIAGFSWLFFSTSVPYTVTILIVLGPGGLGLFLIILSGYVTGREKLERIWKSTSGELFGRTVFVNLRVSKSGIANGGIRLLMQDGSDIFILYNKESTGYVPQLNDLVNITINRKRRAIKTELVEKASPKEVIE